MWTTSLRAGRAQVHPFTPQHRRRISRFGVMFFDARWRRSPTCGAHCRHRPPGLCVRSPARQRWSFIPGAALVAHVGPPDPAPAPTLPAPSPSATPTGSGDLGAAGSGRSRGRDHDPMWWVDPDDAVAFVRNQDARALLDGKPPDGRDGVGRHAGRVAAVAPGRRRAPRSRLGRHGLRHLRRSIGRLAEVMSGPSAIWRPSTASRHLRDARSDGGPGPVRSGVPQQQHAT